jgi:hypothetical protein
MAQGALSLTWRISVVARTDRDRDRHALGGNDRGADLSRQCAETIDRGFIADRCAPGFTREDDARAPRRLIERDM